MPAGSSTPFEYFRKSFWWLLGNFLFGLLPLLFMVLVSHITEQKLGSDEVDKNIHDGIVMFVCCAIMGSILLDFLLCGHAFNGIKVIFIFGTPFAIIVLIILNYLFIRMKVIDDSVFDLSSITSKLVISLSVVYCLISKMALYMIEDTK